MNEVVIHIAETKNFSEKVVARLSEFATVKLEDIAASSVGESLKQCDVFWFRLGFKIEAKHLSHPVRCKVIVCPVTGLDHIDLEACRKNGIEVLSLRGEKEFLRTIRATAELTIGLTLALMRNLISACDDVISSNWRRDHFIGHEIYEKRVGILGVGRLGAITASYFSALGADVWGYDIRSFDDSLCKKSDTIEDLFKISDIISIHVSYQESTHHLINRELLQLMNPQALLINTSRGGVVNSEDLLWALENKIIAGAALDVLENEFDIIQNELVSYARTNTNLIITPHIGGNTEESFEKTEMFMFRKLQHILKTAAW